MLEEPLKELQEINADFKKQYDADEMSFAERKKDADERITCFRTMCENPQTSTFEKVVASYFELNEASTMLTIATQMGYNLLLARLIICTNWSIRSIADALGKMENSPLSKSYKEEIEKLKKQLSSVEKTTADMLPYVDMLKIGIEKTKKWRIDNI